MSAVHGLGSCKKPGRRKKGKKRILLLNPDAYSSYCVREKMLYDSYYETCDEDD